MRCCPAAAQERGFQQFVVARDAVDSSIVGFGHLGRLAVGGFLVLATEFQITSVVVVPELRGSGVEEALVDELLHRIPAKENSRRPCSAWALCNDEASATVFEAAGADERGSLGEVRAVNGLAAAGLCVSGGALLRQDGLSIYRFFGRGEVGEYDSRGRLGE